MKAGVEVGLLWYYKSGSGGKLSRAGNDMALTRPLGLQKCEPSPQA